MHIMPFATATPDIPVEAVHALMSTDPSFNHNYALYLAAGYQNDVAAVKHALVDGKLLNLTTTTSCGYIKVDEKIWPKQYTSTGDHTKDDL